MKQEFLDVIRNGEIWFSFPLENENNVREFLIKNNLDKICDIKRKQIEVEVIKKSVKSQQKIVNLDIIETPKVKTTTTNESN
jgi:hypothetical protein